MPWRDATAHLLGEVTSLGTVGDAAVSFTEDEDAF